MKKNVSLMVLGLALMSYLSTINAAEIEPQQEKLKETYLVIYRPGPGWLEGKSLAEQPLMEHGKYMLSLYIKGSMMLAGPLTDGAGGAVVLQVAKESEAKTIVAGDPAVKSGVFLYEIHPWKLQPWAEFAKKTKNVTSQAAPAEH